MLKTISPSQLDAMGCRFAWFLGYKKGFRPKRSAIALEFGTGIHYAMERYYGHDEDLVGAFKAWAKKRIKELRGFPEDADKLKEEVALGVGMLDGYQEEYATESFEVLATEQMLRRKLPPPNEDYPVIDTRLVARLDGLVRDGDTRKLYSLEHKTFGRFEPGFMDRDHQMTAQVWLGQKVAKKLGLDEPVVGVIYNGLRKQLPGPKVKNRLFERHKIYRNPNQIRILLQRAYHQVVEFSQENFPIFPQPNPVKCNMCDFGDVCRAYMLGEDWRFLLQELYSRRGDR